MKKFVCLVLACVLCLCLTGCGKIGAQKAIDIALRDLGVSRIQVATTEASLDTTANPPVYRVVIDRNGERDTFEIQAESGEILSRHVEETLPGSN